MPTLYLSFYLGQEAMAAKNIYFFNPTCEMAVANGSFSYVPPLLLQQMESDLSFLPFVMANVDDLIVSSRQPSPKFIEHLSSAGFNIPEFKSLARLETETTREIGSIFPWGWSPAAHYKFRNLKERCSREFKESAVFDWRPEHRLLYERGTALDLLHKFLEDEPSAIFVEKSQIGRRITSVEQINILLQKHGKIVVKAPLSSSGRGIQIIRRKALNQPNREWISGILKQQHYVIAEPWLDKLLDLSFQFHIGRYTGLKYLGYTLFETNTSGQYQSTRIRPDLKKQNQEINETELEEMIQTTAAKLERMLQESDYIRFYEGFLGVDAMVFKDSGLVKIQPCIEINCRMNMGILSLFCERQIHPTASGKLAFYYHKQIDFSEFVSKKQLEQPVIIDQGKLYSGFFSLTEPAPGQKFGAYLYLDESR